MAARLRRSAVLLASFICPCRHQSLPCIARQERDEKAAAVAEAVRLAAVLSSALQDVQQEQRAARAKDDASKGEVRCLFSRLTLDRFQHLMWRSRRALRAKPYQFPAYPAAGTLLHFQ